MGRPLHESLMSRRRSVIRVNKRESVVLYRERRVALANQQILILTTLARRKGVVTHDQLTRTIDPDARLGNARAQVATQIMGIRRRLIRADIPLSILSVRGRGYYLEPAVQLMSTQDRIGARVSRGQRRGQ
jgi:DNA-binding response OmpR family regulator